MPHLSPASVYTVVVYLASIVVLCGKYGCISATSNTDVSDELLAQKIDDFITTVLECSNEPAALSLAVVKEGRVVLTKGYGYTSARRRERATAQTGFAIGSLTKAFSATLVAHWLDDWFGPYVTLDTPIKSYFPELRLWDDYTTRHVTAKDFLSHRVGPPDYYTTLMMGWPLNVTRGDLVRNLHSMAPGDSSFRETAHYNNILYTVPSFVMEEMRESPWEVLLKEDILDPLGMSSSGDITNTDFTNFALPFYVAENGTLVDLPTYLFDQVHPVGPAGSIFSTADDMTKWMLFLLSGGRTPSGTPLVSPEVLAATFTPVVAASRFNAVWSKPDDPITYVNLGYGLGWGVTNYRGYDQLVHTGGIVTHNSRLWLYPDMGTGVYLCANGPQPPRKPFVDTMMFYASDVLLGLDPWLNSSTVCEDPYAFSKKPKPSFEDNPSIVDKASNTSLLTELVGHYVHPFFQPFECRLSPDSILVLHHGRFGRIQLKVNASMPGNLNFLGVFLEPLTYENNNGSFFQPVTFWRDSDGKVDGLTISLGSNAWVDFTRQRKEEGSNSSSEAVHYSRWAWAMYGCTYILLYLLST